MGKLLDRLQKQLKNPDTKKDAEDCIKIYNWLKSINKDGSVWDSQWTPLVNVTLKGLPSYKRTYKPNIIGYTLLKGINESNLGLISDNNTDN